MLTDGDIKKLIEAEQEVFATRGEIDQRFDGIRQDFSNLQIAIGAYAKKADAYFLRPRKSYFVTNGARMVIKFTS